MAKTTRMSVSEARAQFADLLNRVAYRKERILIERHGKPLAALVPAADMEDLEHVLREGETPPRKAR